jgi:hypothetical protein
MNKKRVPVFHPSEKRYSYAKQMSAMQYEQAIDFSPRKSLNSSHWGWVSRLLTAADLSR